MQNIMNKKAVSPLIATVLLIAFAVSLGAVLLTYMTSLGECGGVSIEIPTVDDEPQICYNSNTRSEEHTSELQSQFHIVCRLLLEKKNRHDSIRSHLPASLSPISYLILSLS